MGHGREGSLRAEGAKGPLVIRGGPGPGEMDWEAFRRLLSQVDLAIQEGGAYSRMIRDLGAQVLETFEALDPLIQELTSRVCPYCGTVCCINRHGLPDLDDVVVIRAMGLDLPSYDLSRRGADICQFIGPKGCVLPRARRPYRCTWYFCDPLRLQWELLPLASYRAIEAGLVELAGARQRLMSSMEEILREAGVDY